jgi:hypothetical protein
MCRASPEDCQGCEQILGPYLAPKSPKDALFLLIRLAGWETCTYHNPTTPLVKSMSAGQNETPPAFFSLISSVLLRRRYLLYRVLPSTPPLPLLQTLGVTFDLLLTSKQYLTRFC